MVSHKVLQGLHGSREFLLILDLMEPRLELYLGFVKHTTGSYLSFLYVLNWH